MGWKDAGDIGGGWWTRAACAGSDPSMWADGSMYQQAVGMCLACPVRKQCGEEAVASGDVGVIRAGVLFAMHGRRQRMFSLVCQVCGARPVGSRHGLFSRYCGLGCAAQARAAESVLARPLDSTQRPAATA